MFRTAFRGSLVLALVLAGGRSLAGEPPFRIEVESQFGEEGAWTRAFVADAATHLVEMMAQPDVKPLDVLRVRLVKDPAAGSVAGWAGGGEIGFRSNAWPKDRYRLWIVAHELANQLAACYAGAGGFPSDWWSNGRSPFPLYVACLLLEKTGHADAAKWCRETRADQPDHRLYWKLHERHGFALFARFFRLLRADGVDLGAIGTPWPAPDRVRSAYTIAYLSIAAGENLAGFCRNHGIGNEPPDWKQRHPEIPFVPYEVSTADVEAVLAARGWLFGEDANREHHEGLRAAYRKGGALGGRAPVRFRVTSAFGAESDWVEGFLARAAGIVVDRLGAPDRAPPAVVDVRLDENPAAGGIGGGPEGGGLRYVSNCWPEEPFRLWILSRDLVRMLVGHYGGGGIPEELWTTDRLGDVLAVGLLRDLGHAKAADWLAKLTADPARAIPRAVAERGGLELFGRFLRLLRENGVDLAEIGAPGPLPDEKRTLHAVAYLSIAAGENLAPALRELGLGKKPADWEARHPDVPFVEYEVTAAEVDALRKERERKRR